MMRDAENPVEHEAGVPSWPGVQGGLPVGDRARMKTRRVTVGQMEDGGTACQGGQCDNVTGKMECGRRWYQGGGWEL